MQVPRGGYGIPESAVLNRAERLGDAKSGFDARIDLSLGELSGDADAVHDCLLVRRSVADDAHAADAEQGRAAILGVIEALLEVVECAARQQGTDLRGDGRLQRLAQQQADQLDRAFTGLDGDVAYKAVADSHVNLAVE